MCYEKCDRNNVYWELSPNKTKKEHLSERTNQVSMTQRIQKKKHNGNETSELMDRMLGHIGESVVNWIIHKRILP